MNLSELAASKNVIVCVGSGGVGKTTVSAVIAMHAALMGRKVLVMTIDPARRLANSLGLEELDDEIQRIDLTKFDPAAKGELWATMLDMKRAFDDIVERYANTDAEKQSLLNNRFYTYFSTSLAGAQELSASDKLYTLHSEGDYDLIVLDTPPTTNALDFLDAPTKFYEAIDGAAFDWMINAGKNASKRTGLLSMGTGFVIKNLGRFTGTGFLEDLVEFLKHFSALFEGFRTHTRATTELFAADDTSFVIVTSPDPTTVDEASYFRERLKEFNVSLGAIIVNRVRQKFEATQLGDETVNAVTDALMDIEGAKIHGRAVLAQLARKLLGNAHEFDRLADRDQEMITELKRRITDRVPVQQIPMYAQDVHDLDALLRLRSDLFES